jgi:hypothetical protein
VKTLFNNFSRIPRWCLLAVWVAGVGFHPALSTATPWASPAVSEAGATLNWQSPARLHHGLRKVRGTLIINDHGVEFKSEKDNSQRWPFLEIQTFDLSRHRLVLTGYENRGKRLPGDRRFRFNFSQDVSPVLAAELARRVAKPVKNREPDPDLRGYASIPARHTARTGGSNGVLHFRDEGIDFVTPANQDSRSWRWSDIQTLASPDAYHFRVGAYREIFDFELKEPMSRELFDKLWDYVYGRDLGIKSLNGGGQP